MPELITVTPAVPEFQVSSTPLLAELVWLMVIFFQPT